MSSSSSPPTSPPSSPTKKPLKLYGDCENKLKDCKNKLKDLQSNYDLLLKEKDRMWKEIIKLSDKERLALFRPLSKGKLPSDDIHLLEDFGGRSIKKSKRKNKSKKKSKRKNKSKKRR